MADIDKTVEIIFGVVDNASGAFDSIQAKADKFSSNVTQPLADAGAAALKTEAAIIGMGVAFLGVAVNEAAVFQASLNEIGTLFNATPAQVAALKDEVIAFGADSVFSLEDTTGALYDMVSATGDVDNAVAGLASAQELATVAGTTLGTSVNSLTTVLNSYGQSMTDADGVSDALFITVQNGKTTLQELDANLGKVTATAAAAGVPFDDLGAATAALTGAGNETAAAMTQLQNLIKELADPTDVLQAAMGGLSLETDGLKPVMEALQVATGGNFKEMNALFGTVEATKGALVLANDASGTFAGTLQAMADKTGVVTANMALMEQNLSLVTQNMKTNLDIAFIAIGDKLTGEWTGIVSSLSSLFKGTTVALDAGSFDLVFEGLNSFQSAMSTYMEGIAEALPAALEQVDFSGVVAAFGDLGDSLGGIFGDLDLTDADDLAKAIQFVVDGVESLTRVVSGIVQAWTPAIQLVVASVEHFNGLDASTKSAAGNLLGASQVFETFKGILPAVGTGLATVDSIFKSIAEMKTAGAITTLGTAFTKLPITNITSGLGKILTALTGPVGMVVAAGLAGVALGSLLKDGIDTLIQKATGVEGATLGSWIYDVLHADEGTTTASLGKIAAQIVKMDGFDYQFTDKILDFLQADTTSATTSGLLLDIEEALGDVSDADAEKIAGEVFSIIEGTTASTDSTEDQLQDLLDKLDDVGGVDYDNLQDEFEALLGFSTNSVTTDELIGKIKEELVGLQGLNVTKLNDDITNIIEGGFTEEATKIALGNVLINAQALSGNDGLPKTLIAVRDFDKELKDAADNAETWEGEMGKALDIIKDMPGIFIKADGSVKDHKDAVKALSDAWENAGKDGGTADQLRDATADLMDELDDPNNVLTDAEKNTRAWIKAAIDQKDAAEKAKKPINELKDSMGTLTDAEKLAADQAHDTEIKLLDLASNQKIAEAQSIRDFQLALVGLATDERIKAMEFKVELDIAKVQANAVIVEAAFASIGAAIAPLAEAVVGLWGLFSDTGSISAKRELAAAAKRMEDRLNREITLQEYLVEAQVEYMRGQTEALYASTEVVITSDGLDADLEAIMITILNRIRTKIVGNYNHFLTQGV